MTNLTQELQQIVEAAKRTRNCQEPSSGDWSNLNDILFLANSADILAQRLLDIGKILGPKLSRDIPYLSDETQSAVTLTMAESRELQALLRELQALPGKDNE